MVMDVSSKHRVPIMDDIEWALDNKAPVIDKVIGRISYRDVGAYRVLSEWTGKENRIDNVYFTLDINEMVTVNRKTKFVVDTIQVTVAPNKDFTKFRLSRIVYQYTREGQDSLDRWIQDDELRDAYPRAYKIMTDYFNSIVVKEGYQNELDRFRGEVKLSPKYKRDNDPDFANKAPEWLFNLDSDNPDIVKAQMDRSIFSDPQMTEDERDEQCLEVGCKDPIWDGGFFGWSGADITATFIKLDHNPDKYVFPRGYYDERLTVYVDRYGDIQFLLAGHIDFSDVETNFPRAFKVIEDAIKKELDDSSFDKAIEMDEEQMAEHFNKYHSEEEDSE